MKNIAFNPVDQNEQRQITGGNRLPHFVKVLIRKLLRPTDGLHPEPIEAFRTYRACPDSLGSVIMDGDTSLLIKLQSFKSFSIMNKKFIALTQSEQRQITGGSWFTRAIAWCRSHIFGWSDTIHTLPGEPSCSGVGVSFSI